MKRAELLLTALLLPVDAAMILLAFWSAYRLRLEQGNVNFYWPLDQYFEFALLLIPFWLLIFTLVGLYSTQLKHRPWEELAKLFAGVSGGTFLVIAWPFLTRQEFFSRLVVIYIFVFALTFMILGRLVIRWLRHFLYLYGVNVLRVILYDTSPKTRAIEDALRSEIGYQVVKKINRPDDLPPIKRGAYDLLIVTNPSLEEKEALRLIAYADAAHIEFQYVPNLFAARASHVEPLTIGGIPVFRLRRTPLDDWGRIVKRLIDILMASLALLLSLPVMLLVACLIYFESPGAVLFRQTRVGSGGKPFRIIKFRSMDTRFAIEKSRKEELAAYRKMDADKVDEVTTKHVFYQKADDDPRITRIGRFIRKTNLDELPQLFNVLKGDMSLVGPRPLRPEEFEQVSAFEQSYYWVFHVKPGMTGPWQVSGRSDLSDEERIQLDLDYVEQWSLSRDFWVLWRTLVTLLDGRGAR